MSMTIFFIATLVISICTFFISIRTYKYFQLKKVTKRFKRASKKEYEAKSFLEKKGFKVIQCQKEFSYTLLLNKQETTVNLRFDYIVEKSGKRFIAEVKTGKTAININHAPTRRQLLEYCYATGSKGILLVDMENKKISTIEFTNSQHLQKIKLLALGFILGTLCITSLYMIITELA